VLAGFVGAASLLRGLVVLIRPCISNYSPGRCWAFVTDAERKRMAENAQEQVLGYLADRRQAAENELDAARRELEAAQNRLADAEDYARSVEETQNHHKARSLSAH
jgi:hypothetical protein